MTSKSDKKQKDIDPTINPNLCVLNSKRNILFERMQTIFDIAKRVESKTADPNALLCNVTNLDNFRHDFVTALDAYNLALAESNPSGEINYQPWTAFEEMYCYVKRIIESLQQPSVSSMVEPQSHSLKSSKPYLPPIELLSFNGDVRNWPLFYQQFKSVVHDNQFLSNSEKVFYLVGKLTDKATSVCSGLPPTAENYNIIWGALVNKYENPRTLASSYINRLLEFKPLTNNSTAALDSFLYNFNSPVEALKQLNITDLTDFIFLYIALQKLDSETVKLFEIHSNQKQLGIPSYASLIKFIREQSRSLVPSSRTPDANFNKRNYNNSNSKKFTATKSFVTDLDSTNCNSKCTMCRNYIHLHLYQCSAFMKLNPHERYDIAKKTLSCVNCLSTKHKLMNCTSRSTCSYCSARHHSLLHFDTQIKKPQNKINTKNYNRMQEGNNAQTSPAVTRDSCDARPHGAAESPSAGDSTQSPQPRTHANYNNTAVCNHSSSAFNIRTGISALLGTAKIKYIDPHGRCHLLRCLIDPGSQSDYITNECCNRLSLQISNKTPYTKVQGIGGTSQKINGITYLDISSRFNNNSYSIKPLVVERITSLLPDSYIDTSAIKHITNLPLADDEYFRPGHIDILLGVNFYCDILLFNKMKGDDESPVALETTLGYILLGNAPILSQPQASLRTFCSVSSDHLDLLLEKFWQVEEPPTHKYLSPDDTNCENIFTTTTVRNSNGTYSVDLPFKDDPVKLGDSFSTAQKRFLSLENKFKRFPHLRLDYNKIIQDYLDTGILHKVPQEDICSTGFFLPHHPVIRNDKSTTKIRIVLDGSATTDTGISLNDILHTGCNLQAEIFNILLNVRIFRIAFFADVRQMYLCIYVNAPHRKYQRILYRFSTDEPISVLEFTRVTFGLRSSPFLALRTLRQLASDEREKYPLASSVVERDIYMDDLASSSRSVDEAAATAQQLIQLFKAGGFDLVKWSSNSRELLDQIPTTHRQSESISFDDGIGFKVLGLRWLPASDEFIFIVTQPTAECTKRAILSATARLYDVLGLVGPVILFAKLLIKELWLLHIDWDETPPSYIVEAWERYISELPLLSQLRFSRFLNVESDSLRVYLVAFADASEKAYGCVIYLYVQNQNAVPKVSLVCSKSRVASPKSTTTIARLELNALVLLAKMVTNVYNQLSERHTIDKIFAFSDSEVALCWVHASPHRFQTYVANRISQIQALLSAEHFYHIAGTENPADCISRSLLPTQLITHNLWFHGPAWLSLPQNEWPVKKNVPSKVDLPEEKTVSHVVKNSKNLDDNPVILLSERISKYNTLLRTLVYVFRFKKKFKSRGNLTVQELEQAERYLIFVIQNRHFEYDITNIKNNKLPSSSLRKLAPFIDGDNILRVGGRLSYSSLDYQQKHPALLPKNNKLVELLIDYYHRKYCHAGPQLLISILRNKFWILSARRVIKQRIHNCLNCFRLNPKPTFPLMSDLPQFRLEPCNAFTHTGVDYAGPLYITLTRKRGVRSQKAYLCLFICLVTKAVHIELASDLSSASFLDAFKRFLARRGPCQFLYSDNGTNFIASKGYLNDLFKFLLNEEYYKLFNEELNKHRIVWRTNPPTASHFGGIWESNIKSIKSLLFRVIGKQLLTYEEMLTVLNQIEAVLNSRPLYVLSSDPSEPTALTPAHFIRAAPLNFLPATDLSKEKPNLLSRFSLMDSLVQSFWKRFKSEYLHNLQSREKWNTNSNPVKVGTIVLIDTENIPPLQWPMGVITRLYPGKDGVIRVAQVKAKSGLYDRPVVRLCPLPIHV